ncbi:MAG: DMT family transporter, partial [Oscillospiraceae bacterium]
MTASNKRLGAALMILSAFSFSAMKIAIRLASERIPQMEQICCRNFIALLVVMAMLRKQGLPLFGTREQQPLLCVRSSIGFVGLLMIFTATKYGTQADVSILSKMSPFFVTLLAAVFLHERIGRAQIPALLIAFAGAFFVANPKLNSDSFPLIMAGMASVVSGVTYTILRYLGGRVHPMTVVMHFSTFSMLASLPFVLVHFVMPTPYEAVMMLLIGVFGSMGQVLVTYAYKLAPAAEVSIYDYTGILF